MGKVLELDKVGSGLAGKELLTKEVVIPELLASGVRLDLPRFSTKAQLGRQE